MCERGQGYWIDHDEEMMEFIKGWVSENGKEVWRLIPGYSRYEVNKKGDIKDRTTGQLIKGHMDKRRLRVNLRNDSGVIQRLYVDIVVAQTYLQNRDECRYVHHKNNNLLDNREENLKWSNCVRQYVPPSKVAVESFKVGGYNNKQQIQNISFHEIKCPSCTQRMDWKYMFTKGLHCRCGVEIKELAKQLDSNSSYQFYTYFIKQHGKPIYVGVTETSLVRRLVEHSNATLKLSCLTNANLSKGGYTVHVSVILGECELMDLLKPRDNRGSYNQKRYSKGVRLFRNGTLQHFVANKDGKYHQDLHIMTWGQDGTPTTRMYKLNDYVGMIPVTETVRHKIETAEKEKDIRRQFCYNPAFKGVHYTQTRCMCERPCKLDYYRIKKEGEAKLQAWREMKKEEGYKFMERYGKVVVNEQLKESPFVLYLGNSMKVLDCIGCIR